MPYLSPILRRPLGGDSFRAPRCLNNARALTLEMIATPSGRAISSEPFTVESSSVCVQVHASLVYLGIALQGPGF